jgi:cell wall-associated NlpC family hydrolase
MKRSALIFLVPLLHSCAPVNGSATYVPPAASSVTRTQAVASAYAYTQVSWIPTEKNVRHQQDSEGIIIHTPDQSLKDHNFPNGWWKVGAPQTGMPYMWGGFDTPASFLEKLSSGHAAGDIATPAKRSGGDKLVSRQATGIDCSGLISRCWRLPRAYSTAELPGISDGIEWRDLKAGDILLNDRHVLLFKQWGVPGSSIQAYEAGPFPCWKVSAAHIPVHKLVANDYRPRRYRHIIE